MLKVAALAAMAAMAFAQNSSSGTAQDNPDEDKDNLIAYRVQVGFYGPGIQCTSGNSTQSFRRLQDSFDDNDFATTRRPSVTVLTSGVCQVVPDHPGNSYQVNCNSAGTAGSAYFCSDTACQNCNPVGFTNGECFSAPQPVANAAEVWKMQCYNPYEDNPAVDQGEPPEDGAGAATLALAAIAAASAAAMAAF